MHPYARRNLQGAIYSFNEKLLLREIPDAGRRTNKGDQFLMHMQEREKRFRQDPC